MNEELKLQIKCHRSPDDRHSSHQKQQVMPLPLFLFGKRGHQAQIVALSPGDSARSRVLYIHERNSGERSMVDYGADVSAIPLSHADHQRANSGLIHQPNEH